MDFRPWAFEIISPPWIFILGHFGIITTMDFHPWAFEIISPPWIFHPWAFEIISPPWIFILGHFEIITTIDFYLWAFQISPPQIRHLWAFQIHHHRFSSMSICFRFTTIDFHLWAFQLFHHHGFSSLGFRDFHHHRLASMGIFIVSPPQVFTYGPSSLVFRVSFFWFGFQSYYFLSLAFRVSFFGLACRALFSYFLVQRLESVLSCRVTAPSVHILQHCMSHLHGFALILTLLTSLPCAYRLFISQSTQGSLLQTHSCSCSRVVRPLLTFSIDFLSHSRRRLRGSLGPQCDFRGIL